jgi:hypothetical protein
MSEPLTDADLERTISHKQLTAITGYGEQTFRKTLASRGYIPAPVRGKYQLARTLAGLHRYLREQAARNNKPEMDAKKERKLQLEIERLEREKQLEEGKLLTVEELKDWGNEFFPQLIQMLKVLFEIEIPASCAGLPEAAIRAWCKKKHAQALKLWRDAGQSLESEEIVSKRAKGK